MKHRIEPTSPAAGVASRGACPQQFSEHCDGVGGWGFQGTVYLQGRELRMAGDWTKMRDDLADDPAVITIASELKIDVDAVVGKLLRVWSWAGRHTLNGKINGAFPAQVDHIARQKDFASAMQKAGWLSIEDTLLIFPRWNSHNSKSAKRRALEQKRKSAARLKNVRIKSGHYADKNRTREEKRREDISASADITPIPPSLDTAEFREAWSHWLADRAYRKKRVTPRAAAAHMRELESLGLPDAISCIDIAINRSWTGLKAEWYRNATPNGLSDKPRRKTNLERPLEELLHES